MSAELQVVLIVNFTEYRGETVRVSPLTDSLFV